MLTNLAAINQEEATNLTRFYIRANDNVFLFGPVGVGKTSIAAQSVLASGYKGIYINLSVVERCDLMGMPDMHSNAEFIEYKSPYFLPALKDDKPKHVLLLDEIDKAPSETTHPLLEILQARTINGKKLDIAACVLTGNLPDDNSGSNFVSRALLGRGAKYLLNFDFDKWMTWARANNTHDLVLGFLQHHPELCNQSSDAMASPSPRSWTLASEAIIKAREFKMVDIETVSAIVSGHVGYEVGQQFRIWYEHYRRMEPMALNLVEKAIHPAEWDDWSPTEQIVFVITAGHMARLRFVAASKTKPKYGCIDRLCGFLNGIEPEMQALALHNSFGLDFAVDPRWKLYQCPAFFEISKRLSGKD